MQSDAQEDAQEYALDLEGAAARAYEAVRGIAMDLERRAQEIEGQRRPVEQRWLDDYRQYVGRYDDATDQKLKQRDTSRIYANLTRQKTDAWAARLYEMLFPTDDKNWGIQPTPVPELSEMARLDPGAPPLDENGQPIEEDPATAEAREIAQAAAAEMEAARRAAEAHERVMEDQFRQARYGHTMRDVIDDLCLWGTGICKGPLPHIPSRPQWRKIDNQWQPVMPDKPRPIFQRVDPWSFFPDPNARRLEEAEYTFERHLMTLTDLRALARQDGYDTEAIRRVIETGKAENSNMPDYLPLLREIGQEGQNTGIDGRYVVWEYRGTLDHDQVQMLALYRRDGDVLEDMREIDPLEDVRVVCYVCRGEVLRFGLSHLDHETTIYSAAPFSRDVSGIWGYGIPSIVRDPQRAFSSAWRATMDAVPNAVGPQIIINNDVITPQDGNWGIRPFKIWLRKALGVDDRRSPFDVQEIPFGQGALDAVMQRAAEFADSESAMPMIAQGEKGAVPEQTASGMAMLMNSANVMVKRVVRNFDDDLTVPNIRRQYQWNMQYVAPDRPEIVGDFDVDARGSSVLTVKEIETQNLGVVVNNLTVHPVVGPMLKGYDLTRRYMRTLGLDPAETMASRDDYEKMLTEQAQQAQQEPAEDPAIAWEREKLAIEREENQAEREFKMQITLMEQETALIKLATERDIKIEDLNAKLTLARETLQSKERVFAGEAALKQMPPHYEGI